MSGIGEHALLCVGLRRDFGLKGIAPRLILADGTVIVAEGMDRGADRGDFRPSTLAQRVTYLAQVVGIGIYDCEVVRSPPTPSAPLTPGDEVPIISPRPLTDGEIPAWATALFKAKGWTLGRAP